MEAETHSLLKSYNFVVLDAGNFKPLTGHTLYDLIDWPYRLFLSGLSHLLLQADSQYMSLSFSMLLFKYVYMNLNEIN